MAQVIQKRPQQVHGRVNSDTLLQVSPGKEIRVNNPNINLPPGGPASYTVTMVVESAGVWSVSKGAWQASYSDYNVGNLKHLAFTATGMFANGEPVGSHAKVLNNTDDLVISGDVRITHLKIANRNWTSEEIREDSRQPGSAPSSTHASILAHYVADRQGRTMWDVVEQYNWKKVDVTFFDAFSTDIWNSSSYPTFQVVDGVLRYYNEGNSDATRSIAYQHSFSPIDGKYVDVEFDVVEAFNGDGVSISGRTYETFPATAKVTAIGHYKFEKIPVNSNPAFYGTRITVGVATNTSQGAIDNLSVRYYSTLEAQHASLINYTDSEVGLPNVSTQVAYKDFYSKQNLYPYCYYSKVDRYIIYSRNAVGTLFPSNSSFTFLYIGGLRKSVNLSGDGEPIFEIQGNSMQFTLRNAALGLFRWYFLNGTYQVQEFTVPFNLQAYLDQPWVILATYDNSTNTLTTKFRFLNSRTTYQSSTNIPQGWIRNNTRKVYAGRNILISYNLILYEGLISQLDQDKVFYDLDFTSIQNALININYSEYEGTVLKNIGALGDFDVVNGSLQPLTIEPDVWIERKSLLPALQNALRFEAGKTGSGGNLGTLQGIAFAVKLNTANQNLFQLAATTTTQIGIQSNTFQLGASITGITVWVDGIAQTLAKAGQILNDLKLHHVTVQFTAITATNFQILSFDGFLASLIYLKEKLTRKEGIELNNNMLLARPKKAIQAKAEGIINFNRINDTAGVYSLEDLSGKNHTIEAVGYNATQGYPVIPLRQIKQDNAVSSYVFQPEKDIRGTGINTATLNYTFPASFSLEVFFKRPTVASPNGTNQYAVFLRNSPSGYLNINYKNNYMNLQWTHLGAGTQNGHSQFLYVTPAPTDWMHLVVTFSYNQEVAFYVNGEKFSNTVDAFFYQDNPTTLIQLNPQGDNNTYSNDGQVRCLRVYDKILTQADVDALRVAGKDTMNPPFYLMHHLLLNVPLQQKSGVPVDFVQDRKFISRYANPDYFKPII